jgi:hypothetical protein
MITSSNLRKSSLLELNAYLKQSFEKRIYENVTIQECRRKQLLELLSKSKEELSSMAGVN